jgi:hypothetical protein
MREKYQYLTISVKSIALGSLRIFVTLSSLWQQHVDEYGYSAMVDWYWQGKTEVMGVKHYTAWVVDGWMSMEQRWNDADWGKPQ